MDNGALIILLVVPIYFLPSIVAAMRKQSNTTAIFFLNLFLGWSLIGWVIALVWALKKPETVAAAFVSSSSADEIKKLKELADAGIISQAEYDAKKQLLLR
jgi:hypothetical protein